MLRPTPRGGRGTASWPGCRSSRSRSAGCRTPRRGRLAARVEPNETIDQAEDLGTLNQPVEVVGSIGNGPAGAADVTWYHFKLADPSRVDLEVSTPAGDPPFASVLSLYNNDPEDFGDPYDLDGHRLLAQVQANPTDGAAVTPRTSGRAITSWPSAARATSTSLP